MLILCAVPCCALCFFSCDGPMCAYLVCAYVMWVCMHVYMTITYGVRQIGFDVLGGNDIFCKN